MSLKNLAKIAVPVMIVAVLTGCSTTTPKPDNSVPPQEKRVTTWADLRTAAADFPDLYYHQQDDDTLCEYFVSAEALQRLNTDAANCVTAVKDQRDVIVENLNQGGIYDESSWIVLDIYPQDEQTLRDWSEENPEGLVLKGAQQELETVPDPSSAYVSYTNNWSEGPRVYFKYFDGEGWKVSYFPDN